MNTNILLARVDQNSLVLLQPCLDNVGREAVSKKIIIFVWRLKLILISPQQVHESVSCCDISLPCLFLKIFFIEPPSPRLDGGDQDDAQDDRQDGGGHVVNNSTESNLSWQGQVHGSYGSYEGGDDEGDDDTLEHVEEELSNIADIHGISLAPWLIWTILQWYSKDHTWKTKH